MLPASGRATDGNGKKVLYVESYGAGSHLRTARLIQSRSRHAVDIVSLDRDPWRMLAFTGHRAVLNALETLADRGYEVVLFSGPADIRLVQPKLPSGIDTLPIIAYFHESQWNYPAQSLDRIPHLVSHLEAVEVSDAIWFNSRYHRRIFHQSAISHTSRTVRSLAREIIPVHWQKTGVVYPPVQVERRNVRRNDLLTISWSARWEAEKRPDLMLEIVRTCLGDGLDISLIILGCDSGSWSSAPEMTDELLAIMQPGSGFVDRDSYEEALASSDIWLSTTEHEFFGVSAIEAAMLGATPVVPVGLAYPETLPSAYCYPPGDMQAAVARIAAIAAAELRSPGPWVHDAERFSSDRTVRRFDDGIDELVAGHQR